jgi:asparagine synthase (glutamine-hydrolysing)
MSIIFGILKDRGATVFADELRRHANRTESYAPDGVHLCVDGSIGMGFQPYHTHLRSKLEIQPILDDCGHMLSFDGRLDNYGELIHLLDIGDKGVPDSTIVLSAFRRWGEGCFARFVGDWALALWSGAEQTIYLARDHAGTRTLYYEKSGEGLRWSTYLETFFDAKQRRPVNESYAACYLARRPVREMTPFGGISSVPPAHYLKIQEGGNTCKAYWECVVKNRIQYTTDTEYEEHFLHLFRQSVERRTVPGSPILAHLSGGMDSTSIVCMSDSVRRERKVSSKELLDTLSYYDDSEPNWNETPYFNIVEEKRGKQGIHIDLSRMQRTFEPYGPAHGIFLWPGADQSTLTQEMAFEKTLGQREFRTVLSGLGGDELLGGSPNALLELGDYLMSGKIRLWLKRSLDWSVVDRTSLVQLLFKTCISTAGLYQRPRLNSTSLPPWLSSCHKRMCAQMAQATRLDWDRFRSTPTSIGNGIAWGSIMETLRNSSPRFLCRREFRYPYLDRDLVDFLIRIPREQLVHPGRRRSLMRRALRNITPVEILERRRKAFMSRRLQDSLRLNRQTIGALFEDPLGAQIGLYERRAALAALDSTIHDDGFRSCYEVERLITYELWLRGNQNSLRNFRITDYGSAPNTWSDEDPDNILSGRMSCLEIAEK